MDKVVIGIIAVVILFIMFPLVLSSAHTIQTEEQKDAGLPCVSSPEDVTLRKALWQDDLNSFISGVDSEGNVLTATGYNPTSKVLTVTGWVTPATTCTIVYEVEGLKEYTGMGAIVGIAPLLIFIGVIFSILGGLFLAFKGRFGGG